MKKKNLLSLLFVICLSIASTIFFGFSPADSVVVKEPTVSENSIDGLGYGVNLLTLKNASEFNEENTVLRLDAIEGFRKGRIATQISHSSSWNFPDVSILLDAFSSSAKAMANKDGLHAFSSEVTFSPQTLVEFAKSNGVYFSYFYQYHNKEERFIQNYLCKQIYENAFSEEFLLDLNAVKVGSLSIEELFDKYGTHLIGSGIYGGRISYVYSLNESGEISDIRLTSQGGSKLNYDSLENLNSSYLEWCNSLNDINNTVLVDFKADGLVPIWDILPDEYLELVVQMENKFNALSEVAKQAFLEEYKILDNSPVGEVLNEKPVEKKAENKIELKLEIEKVEIAEQETEETIDEYLEEDVVEDVVEELQPNNPEQEKTQEESSVDGEFVTPICDYIHDDKSRKLVQKYFRIDYDLPKGEEIYYV